MFFSSVSAITKTMGYGLAWGALCLCPLLGFWDEEYVSQPPLCGIMLLLREVLNMLARNVNQSGSICFRCLMFSLPGPCELLIYFIVLPLGPELWLV